MLLDVGSCAWSCREDIEARVHWTPAERVENSHVGVSENRGPNRGPIFTLSSRILGIRTPK